MSPLFQDTEPLPHLDWRKASTAFFSESGRLRNNNQEFVLTHAVEYRASRWVIESKELQPRYEGIFQPAREVRRPHQSNCHVREMNVGGNRPAFSP